MTVVIMISYLGWVSAQVTALGLVFNVVSGGGITTVQGMAIGTAIVLIYTMFGGMWSVALTDFVQMTSSWSGMLADRVVSAAISPAGPPVVIAHGRRQGLSSSFPSRRCMPGSFARRRASP